MAMVKQMLKSQSFKQCRLCCFVFLSSANIFVVPFLGKCLDKGKREVTEDDEREADALCKRHLERWKEELE